MRQNDLDVRLGTERSRFKQRLLVVNATPVNVLARSNVVESVGHTVEVLEEVITVDV